MSEAEEFPPEMPRRFAVDRLDGAVIEVIGTEAECAALAVRLLVPAVGSIYGRWHLRALPGGQIAARGLLKAAVTQICVVTLDPFEEKIEEEFEVRFVPEADLAEEDESEEIDEIPYRGSEIDLGEAIAEQLALSLDPFPRKPGAVLPETLSDPEPHPFSILSQIKDRK